LKFDKNYPKHNYGKLNI